MAERTHSEGWITFAAILAGIAGGVNTLFGIAAMFGLGRFSDPALMFTSLYAFGLLLLSAGIVQLVTSPLLVRRNALGRIAGIIVASVSILMWSLWLGAYTHVGPDRSRARRPGDLRPRRSPASTSPARSNLDDNRRFEAGEVIA